MTSIVLCSYHLGPFNKKLVVESKQGAIKERFHGNSFNVVIGNLTDSACYIPLGPLETLSNPDAKQDENLLGCDVYDLGGSESENSARLVTLVSLSSLNFLY